MQNTAFTLPEPLRQSAEEQAAARGFRNVEEYVGRLVERDLLRQSELQQLEAQLLEGLQGDPIEATDEWWEEFKKRMDKRYPPPRVV